MKRAVVYAAIAVAASIGIFLALNRGGGSQAIAAALPNDPSTNSPTVTATPTNSTASREFDSTVNPYAGALREPGKSKRTWPTNFLAQYQNAKDGDSIQFELTAGKTAMGTIRLTQFRDGELNFISGELTSPEAGKFFFLTPPVGGKAGKAVGIIEFPASHTAYRIEPTGTNGDPELWQRRLDEVVCANMPLAESSATDTNQVAEAPPLRPDIVPGLTPSYNSNIVSLQSYPGSSAVLLLDFFGGYTPTWNGGVAYPKPNVSNDQIRDLWKRVAEDFMPFNINVTTDIKVYLAAPAASRQRCAFTPSTSAVGSGAAGVAFIGSWNWGSDTVCWSIYTSGKNGAEVGAHEPGHTLGLGHQNTTTNDYYAGHGSGPTGWGPTMGVGYYQPVSSWAKGEYYNAANFEDELTKITTQNNNVTYRPDDTGATLATSRYLEIFSDLSVSAEGVIERTSDDDAFQFTTTGGQVGFTAKPVGDWASLAVALSIADATDTIIASNNPQNVLTASISTNLPAGTYTVHVTGMGRNSPLTNGFSAYGSLGYYSIVGSVTGARLPTRLTVIERATNNTFVGNVVAMNTNDPLAYAITSGNTSNAFAIDNNGALRVANNAILDYNRLATNTSRTVQFELFMNITNLNDDLQTELNRRVVVEVLSTNVNQPIVVAGFNAGVIAPYNATPALPKATAFDIPNNWSFYQAGLDLNPQVGGTGGGQGFPAGGVILSPVDGTRFQLGNYGATNALILGNTYPRFGTLTLATPRAYNSLAILASSANGGGSGTFVLNFTNGTKSPVFSFNAQDWFNTTVNVAAQGFGRLRLGQATLNTENPGWNNPNLYQTTLNLAAIGSNLAIASITFTNPAAGTLDSGVFAVSGVAMPQEVSITQQPQSVTNINPLLGATFTTVAMGAPPLAFQWYFSTNGNPATAVPLNGQTASSLMLPAELQSSNAGSYFVVVTNSSSVATSSIATLTLFRSPIITLSTSPTNLSLFVGQSLTLFAAANAAIPLTYNWRKDANVFAIGSGSNYLLGSLQISNSGNYSVILSNAYGMATSSVVALTVLPNPTNSGYASAIIAQKPIGFWKLNETSGSIAHDYVGGRNGTFNSVTLNQTGYNPSDSDKAAVFGPGINSYVGGISVDFASITSSVFSVEAWVKGNTQSTDAGIITKGTGSGGEQFNLDTGAGGHAFRFFVRDSVGNAHLANGTIGPNGQWHHVVGVCNQTNGFIVLYVDGVSNATGAITAGAGILSTTNPMTIGSRQSGTTTFNNQFVGTIDEVAVYNFPLSAAQVAAHYAVRTNVAPVFAANPFTRPSAQAGQPYSSTLVGTVSDPNGDALTYSKVDGPSWLLIAGNGVMAGSPVSSDVGANVFTVKASDATGLFTTATMNLSVAVAAPLLLSMNLQDTNVLLNWTGGVPPFQIQTSTNIGAPDWQDFGAPLNGYSLLFTPSNAQTYFRIYSQ